MSNIETDLGLSPDQIRAVQDMWTEARSHGPDEPGASILTAIIEREPGVESIFNFAQINRGQISNAQTASGRGSPIPQLSPVPPEIHNTDKSAGFGIHARRFSSVLDRFVNSLGESNPKSDIALLELGKKHTKNRTFGFSAQLWDVFAECMITETLTWVTDADMVNSVHDAWSSVIFYIISRMKQGYYEDLDKQGRKMSNF